MNLDLPKLSFDSWILGGTYVCTLPNENYLYAEKALELSKNKDLVLHCNDTKSYFTIHYVGLNKGFMWVVGDFLNYYFRLTRTYTL